MDRLSRVISIMIDFMNHKIVDTSYLANKYEVSTRTIYRDIDLLNLSGIPIVSERGKNGGFSILDGFKIDKSILSEQEFSIILRGLQALVNNKDKEAQSVYERLISILENSKKEKIIKQSNHVVIDISPFEMQKELRKLYTQIHEAIEEKRCIKIKYHSIDKGYTERIIEPLALIFKTANWYLYAFCREKQDYRYFKLLRIKNIEVLEEHFAERDVETRGFEYFFTDLEEVEIVLKTDPEYAVFIQENYYITKIEQIEKDVYITMQYPLNNWVYSTILGFGDRVTVISPEKIKNEIKEKIEKMKKLY
jgi:predicted DNA-binding transcriptional regulator YafY